MKNSPTLFRCSTAVAEVQGVDLGEEAERKVAKNARREYIARANGVLVRASRE